jgi:hypothetical protein
MLAREKKTVILHGAEGLVIETFASFVVGCVVNKRDVVVEKAN